REVVVIPKQLELLAARARCRRRNDRTRWRHGRGRRWVRCLGGTAVERELIFRYTLGGQLGCVPLVVVVEGEGEILVARRGSRPRARGRRGAGNRGGVPGAGALEERPTVGELSGMEAEAGLAVWTLDDHRRMRAVGIL